jgi:hypothetical protein
MSTNQETPPAGASDAARQVITETIGFGFEPGELQPVNEDDLMRLAEALTSKADCFPECSGTPSDCPENEGHGCCKAAPPAQVAGSGMGDGLKLAVAQLRGIYRHLRSVPAYEKLRGDADVLEQIERLLQTFAAEPAPVEKYSALVNILSQAVGRAYSAGLDGAESFDVLAVTELFRDEWNRDAQPAPVVGGLTQSEVEWIAYAIDHMEDDSELEDISCAKVLREMLNRLGLSAPGISASNPPAQAALSARPAVEGEAEKYRFLRDKAFLCSDDVTSDASALFDCHGDEFDRRVETLTGDMK